MDYGRLNRRELQALCKQHGIPANRTNVYMAEALGALLDAPKEDEQLMEPIPDPAEVVKSKATRAARSKKIADVLEASEVDELSSQLARSTLAVDSSEVSAVQSAEEDICEAVVEAMIEVRSKFLNDIPMVSADVVQEIDPPVRKPRSQKGKTNMKSLSSLVEAKPALVEPTLEVVLKVEDTTDELAPTAAVSEPKPRIKATYSRRKVKDQEVMPTPQDIIMEEFPQELISAWSESVFTLEQTTSTLTLPSENVPTSEEDTTPALSLPPESVATSEEDAPPTVTPPLVEGTVVIAKAVTKRSKVKGKRSKKVKPISPISLPVLKDGVVPPTTPVTSDAELSIPDSPTLGLAYDAAEEIPLRAMSLSPAPEAEFEFQAVPESFAEIMTPAKPLDEATKGCQHRIGRKFGKACNSCASETKVANIMQEVIQKTMDVPNVNNAPLDGVSEEGNTEILTTPAKQADDKENALKNIDLHSLSIRKLQKEVKRRGLSKRNNTRVKV